MSHEGDDGITSWIVKAVKRHPCLCAVAGTCVAALGGGVYMKSGTENVTECQQVSEKSEKIMIGAKAVKVSNNADVEATNRGTESGVRVVQQTQAAVAVSVGTDANLSTKSRFIDGPEIDIEQPSGPQNSKEEKRKERERRRRWLAALAGMTAATKIMSMMPNPDPNENNRLPDKIPNIPTPQEKWFKWLWEKREMRFEYRPLEFVRAYADKYLEGDAKCVKVGYSYVYNNHYTCNNDIKNEDMKLTELSLLALVTSGIHGPSTREKPVKQPNENINLTKADLNCNSQSASSNEQHATIQTNGSAPAVQKSSGPVQDTGGIIENANGIAIAKTQQSESPDQILREILTIAGQRCDIGCSQTNDTLSIKFYNRDTRYDYNRAIEYITRLASAGCNVICCYNTNGTVKAGIIFFSKESFVYFMIGGPTAIWYEIETIGSLKRLITNPDTPLPPGYAWFKSESSSKPEHDHSPSVTNTYGASSGAANPNSSTYIQDLKAENAAKTAELEATKTENAGLKAKFEKLEQKVRKCPSCGGGAR